MDANSLTKLNRMAYKILVQWHVNVDDGRWCMSHVKILIRIIKKLLYVQIFNMTETKRATSIIVV